jgi:hypothetical protein
MVPRVIVGCSAAMRLGAVDPVPLIQIKQTASREGTVPQKACNGRVLFWERRLNEQLQLHPLAPHHLPFYLAPGSGTDTMMVVMGFFLVGAVLWVGTLYWRLHSLPERMAHKSQKLQFEIVAILGLLSLFTHIHAFWVAALLLALIDIPDFGTPLRSIADSVEKIADAAPGEVHEQAAAQADSQPIPPTGKPGLAKEPSHA